jgi:putative flavoprotein involved in K+ transport
VPATSRGERGRPRLEDGRVLDVGNVVWCTGFHGGYGWVDLPVFDERGEPRHHRGVVEGEPGLYFLGLHFLYAMSSGMSGRRRGGRRVGRRSGRDACLRPARLTAPFTSRR